MNFAIYQKKILIFWHERIFPYIDCIEKLDELCLLRVVLQFIDRQHGIWERLRACHQLMTIVLRILSEYNDLYLKTDIVIDIFEISATVASRVMGSIPRIITSYRFTWDVMLKHTGIKFELLTDISHVYRSRCISSGLSLCSNRYARANNKYMPSYNPSALYLMYWWR